MEEKKSKSLKIKLKVSIDSVDKPEFSDISKSLTSSITKVEKKTQGIFFTPPETVVNMINKVKSLKTPIESILEPSCGSCEFIDYLTKYFSDSKINGIELNKTIFESIKSKQSSNVILLNEDFIKYKDQKKYDLIIGNPPFYVMKKHDAPNNYHEYFDGRPNIFLLFVIKSLKMLNNNGILSFVLPRNFINCLYYNKTRQFIDQNFKIHFIENCDDEYIDTKQDTIIIIVEKQDNPDNSNFTLKVSDYTIFGTVDNISKLKTYYSNYKTLNELNFQEDIKKKKVDFIVVVAYGNLIDDFIINSPKFLTINVHSSLLPKWRGAAPIQRSILNDDKETGICVMKVEEKLDAGPIIKLEKIKINFDDNAGSIYKKMILVGRPLLVKAIKDIINDDHKMIIQKENLSTYAKKIKKSESRIKWEHNAEKINLMVRAFNPFPGAWTKIRGGDKRIKILKSEVVKKKVASQKNLVIGGVSDNLEVKCGNGSLKILELQLEGKKALKNKEFLNGYKIKNLIFE